MRFTKWVVGDCDLCGNPFWEKKAVKVFRWTFHPKCALVVEKRLMRLADIILDSTDEEFESIIDKSLEKGGRRISLSELWLQSFRKWWLGKATPEASLLRIICDAAKDADGQCTLATVCEFKGEYCDDTTG